MTWLICSTYSSNENYNGDVDYILVNMTEEHAQKLLHLMDTVRDLKKTLDYRVANLQFWSAEFTGLDSAKIDVDESLELGADDQFVEISGESARAAECSCTPRTECDMLVVWEDHVLWKCYPKHAEGVHIESRAIYREDLEKYAGS